MRKFAGMICLLCSGGIAVAHPPGIGAGAVKNPAQGWDSLVDQYFEQVRFKFAPTEGTADGLHQYDSLLEDYSRKGPGALYRFNWVFPSNKTIRGSLGFGQAGLAGGMSHVVEAVRQIQGRADDRQLIDHDVAYVSGTGGIMPEQAALVLRGT